MKKTIPAHPFLFGLFPVLFLYSQNMGQLNFSEILLPSGMVIIFSAAALALLWLIFKKDLNKSAIVTSLFLILFFSYGHIYNLAEGRQVFSLVAGRHRYLVLLWAVLFIIGLIYTIKARIDLSSLTRFLNIIAICLLMVSVVNIAMFKLRAEDAAWAVDSDSHQITESRQAYPQMDIYYIILDGYASSSTLEEVYNYDNSKFIHFLEQKGFYIASESASNYTSSFLSLASSLNMEYVNYLGERLGEKSNDRSLPYKMIEESRVMDFLKSRGYRYIHFSSGWGPTNHNQHADLNIAVSQYTWSEFQTMLFRTTALRVFEQKILKDISRMRVINSFDRLARVPHMEGSHYVFAHIVCPHPPYIFNRDGGPVPQANFDMDIWGPEQKDYYLNQLIYLNKEIMDFVEKVMSESETPPVILLQADHGPRNTFIGGQPPTGDMFREGFRILNAYHMPQQKHDLLYESITPVNSFRVVLNTCFGTSYPLLEDRSYNSFEAEPYRFTDITDTVSYD
ncbi:MAG: hypothetical protein ACQEP5_09360 [Actinomycetota bacterium]